ncbi:hypothetical protein CKO42_25755 [Lamprobacter modestohalophilus]|uniref:Class I SAM-dependent methyltransferase n=2 Tax=Lamprobacter modestohalophilus TaxID=1064514 RepID=A0A9X0WE20_9GAMM|nr:hypothetical protein [Lamprobacter modestohalophilus]
MPPNVNFSARMINTLAKRLDASSYLEIGVLRGKTFLGVDIGRKHAVDVIKQFDIPEYSRDSRFFQCSSDEYFVSADDKPIYDIVFIDGLHTFEQSFRDLSNSLIYTHNRSVIILDDTIPNDVYSSLRNSKQALKYRKEETGGSDLSWHGDVYKTVFLIHDFYATLNYKTIVGAWNPQTLIWRSANGHRTPRFNSLEKIERLSYFDFLEHKDILRTDTEQRAIEVCVEEIGP